LNYRKLREIDPIVTACFITAFETYYEKFRQEFFHLEEIKGFIRKPIQTEELIRFTNKSQGSMAIRYLVFLKVYCKEYRSFFFDLDLISNSS
jgi:hypothetical protein